MQINLLHLLLKREGKARGGGRPLKEEACLWRSWPLRCIEEEEGEVRRVDGDQHSSCAPRRDMLTSPLLFWDPLDAFKEERRGAFTGHFQPPSIAIYNLGERRGGSSIYYAPGVGD